MTKSSTNPQGSNRVQERDALLKEALAQPRVRDIMRVYQNYQKADKGLDPYRLATKRPEKSPTTDRANLQCVKSI